MSHSNDDVPGDQSEDELFRDAIGDVEPLKTARKVTLKRDDTPSAATEARRRAAQDQPEATADGLTGDYVHAVSPTACSAIYAWANTRSTPASTYIA